MPLVTIIELVLVTWAHYCSSVHFVSCQNLQLVHIDISFQHLLLHRLTPSSVALKLLHMVLNNC